MFVRFLLGLHLALLFEGYRQGLRLPDNVCAAHIGVDATNEDARAPRINPSR